MIQTKTLLPGVTLRSFRDTRFKQGCLSFQLVRPMKAEEAAMNALLPSVLLRGTNAHGDLRKITEHLDSLYGASVGTLVRRVGDYQTIGLYSSFIDDRFALPGEQVLLPMLAFLRELLLDSPLEDGGFLPSFVESEKRNLIATIESELNDKRVYAMNRMMKLMCADDPFGMPRLGRKEDVAAIDPGDLYAHYRRCLKESAIHIFYVGSADAEEVAAGLMPILESLDRAYADLPAQTGYRPSPSGDHVETMDVTQGKLCMGFTTGVTNRDGDFAAMQVFNTVFGSGMTSKLFMNVREKLSLCYSIGSGYYGNKGIIALSAGIDFDKEELTRQEIFRQLELCRKGDISDEELTAAKEAISSGLRSTHDTPGAIEGYYATAALSGMGMTPEQYLEAIASVTKSQVVACANRVQLHTTYFLKGVTQ